MTLLRRGDVVLADRYFSGWFDLALLWQRGVHSVVRKHQLRPTDFRTGRRLGQTITWCAGPNRNVPTGCPAAVRSAARMSLTLREVRVRVAQKGFRTGKSLVVTTLLDAELSGSEIATLYRRRWQAELHLRSLKIVLQMDHLRCKTPHRVRNEFYMHLVAYNLIREVMALAAIKAGVEPWTVSFKGALQTLGQDAAAVSTNVSDRRLVRRPAESRSPPTSLATAPTVSSRV